MYKKKPFYVDSSRLVYLHFLLTESVKCPAAGRERGTCMSCHSICLQVGQVHWELYTCTRLPMNPLLRKPNHFRFAMRNCRLRLPVSHPRIYWNRQTYRTISIFANIYTETLKLSTHSHRCLFGGKKFQWCLNKRVAQLKNNSPCRSADALFTLIFPKGWAYTVSLSLSLSLFIGKPFGSRSDPNIIQERMFRRVKSFGMR